MSERLPHNPEHSAEPTLDEITEARYTHLNYDELATLMEETTTTERNLLNHEMTRRSKRDGLAWMESDDNKVRVYKLGHSAFELALLRDRELALLLQKNRSEFTQPYKDELVRRFTSKGRIWTFIEKNNVIYTIIPTEDQYTEDS